MAKISKHRCPECGEEYDVNLHRCPHCKKPNDNRPFTRMTYLPVQKQVWLFVVGFVGLSILSFFFSLFFVRIYKEDQTLGYLLIDSISYVVLFMIMLAIISKNFIDLIQPFKKGRTYIAGLIGGAVLIGVSTLVSYLMSLAVPSAGTGENQSIAVQMILRNPAVCFIILGFIGPLVEECSYRLGLFTLCLRAYRWLAYLVTVIVFTIIHIDFFSDNIVNELVAMPDYFVAAILFCLIYEYEGFGASAIAHIINNVFSIIIILTKTKA